MSSGNFDAAGSPKKSSCSIEIWLQPARSSEGGTILTFYARQHPLRFSLYQSLTDLMIQDGSAKFYVDDIFRRKQAIFVTVTSGTPGTSVYLNGTLARTAPHFPFGASDCTVRLILGDSPLQQDTWSGEVLGLAIYHSELLAPAVLRHYNSWTKNGKPEIAANEHNVGLYLFNERAGRVVQNHARSNLDLTIPDTYTVLDKVMLEPFWKEFNLSRGYWEGILKNIVGFVPFGFCFYAYFSQAHNYRRAALITILSGTAVSLTIEVLQGYLPTRDSGTTDLITNTLGTFIGVLAYRRAAAHFATLPIRRSR
jgi:hypothetical protein